MRRDIDITSNCEHGQEIDFMKAGELVLNLE